MKKRLSGLVCAGLILILAGCSKPDQDRARERADEAQQKSEQEARKLGHEIKQDAKQLDRNIRKSLDGQPGSTQSPNQKLDHAAILAKVKAKLASDVGLSTVASVDVDVNGSVVTLSGAVSTDDQKRQAEHAVSAVDGVTQVVNNIAVRPCAKFIESDDCAT